jgi:O-antigen ligase/polysaccharide polymerase Wzy-like membrane protein
MNGAAMAAITTTTTMPPIHQKSFRRRFFTRLIMSRLSGSALCSTGSKAGDSRRLAWWAIMTARPAATSPPKRRNDPMSHPMTNPTTTVEMRQRDWICGAVLYGLLVVEGWREGGFWNNDAFGVVVVSLAILVVSLLLELPDPRGIMLVGTVVALATWWLVRAVMTHGPEHFLPLGASMLGFAAAYCATRVLWGPTRQLAGFGLALLGGVGALIGLVSVALRWFPAAIPSQNLWRLASTLTYADAAGLALAMCLLVALGLDLSPPVTRIIVCLTMAGLLATQSRGAYVAFLGACLVVPWRRYLHFALPLIAGAVIGACAIASSPGPRSAPWLLVVVLLGGLVSLAPWSGRAILPATITLRTRSVVAIGIAAALAAVVLLHREIGLRALAPSDQDRSIEWSTGPHQWGSAPLIGVGPDRLLIFHAADGSFAHFVHNEYIQIGADAGVIGVALLALSVLAVIRAVRRFDLLASCAVAALVCFAIGGVFDFDWHLSFIGLLAGWCVGLAARRTTSESPPTPASSSTASAPSPE